MKKSTNTEMFKRVLAAASKVPEAYKEMIDQTSFYGNWRSKPDFSEQDYIEYAKYMRKHSALGTYNPKELKMALLIGANKIFGAIHKATKGNMTLAQRLCLQTTGGDIIRIQHPIDKKRRCNWEKNLYWRESETSPLIYMQAANIHKFYGLNKLVPGVFHPKREEVRHEKHRRGALLLFQQFHKDAMRDALKLSYPVPLNLKFK
jgi:hypothetical protein